MKMKMLCSLLLLAGVIVLSGCAVTGLHTGPASLYGKEAMKPEQLVDSLDSFNAWMCTDNARQTAIIFLPKDSEWNIEFRRGGWSKIEDQGKLDDGVMWMRQYFIISEYASGLVLTEKEGVDEFIGYVFTPTTLHMYKDPDQEKTLIVYRLTWWDVLIDGKVLGEQYPDGL